MGISRPQGFRSAPIHPEMVAKSPTGSFHQPGIMMDQCARESLQKVCMLLCQKIIRPRRALRTLGHNSTFVSYNTFGGVSF